MNFVANSATSAESVPPSFNALHEDLWQTFIRRTGRLSDDFAAKKRFRGLPLGRRNSSLLTGARPGLAMLVRRVESTPATGDACRSSRLCPHDDCRACPGSLQGKRPEVHQARESGSVPLVGYVGVAGSQHLSSHRRSETAAMSDAANRLAQALRDFVKQAVQAPSSGSA